MLLLTYGQTGPLNGSLAVSLSISVSLRLSFSVCACDLGVPAQLYTIPTYTRLVQGRHKNNALVCLTS